MCIRGQLDSTVCKMCLHQESEKGCVYRAGGELGPSGTTPCLSARDTPDVVRVMYNLEAQVQLAFLNEKGQVGMTKEEMRGSNKA
jgi:hypothetical protein